MKDLIDERNKREKMQNSIIKWWNVNMVPVEEKKDAFAGLSSEEKEAAKQIIARLDAEAAEDEAIKAKEVEAELKKQEEKEKEARRNKFEIIKEQIEIHTKEVI